MVYYSKITYQFFTIVKVKVLNLMQPKILCCAGSIGMFTDTCHRMFFTQFLGCPNIRHLLMVVVINGEVQSCLSVQFLCFWFVELADIGHLCMLICSCNFHPRFSSPQI